MSLFSTKSIDLDGVNDFISMGNVLDWNGTASRSWVLWFKGTYTETTWTKLMAKQGNTSNPEGWNIELDPDGGIQFQAVHTWGSNYLQMECAGHDLHDNGWHLLVVTANPGGSPVKAATVSIYVDGDQIPTGNITVHADSLANSIANTYDFRIGARAITGSEGYFDGRVNNAAVYGGVLTPSEVAWIHNLGRPRDLQVGSPPPNLASWWKLGDGDTYPTVLDSAGSNNGTMTNMASDDIVGDAPYGRDSQSPIYTVDDLRYSPGGEGSPPEGAFVGDPAAPGGAPKKYKMRAREQSVPAPGYVTWIAEDAPDFAGTGFSGGTPTPSNPMVVGSAVVVAQW